MELWYKLVDFALPFGCFNHIFMKNALLAIILTAPMLGILGTMVVNNKMAFFSDAIGHSALTGIAIGVMLGLPNPLLSIVLFSCLLGTAVWSVKNSNRASTDTIIGVFSSIAVALGIVILSISGGFSKYSTYLIGDLLSIKPGEIFMLGCILLLVLAFWAVAINRLILLSVNKSFARSRGINVKVVEYFFTMLVAVVVAVSIQWVGLLIINSLLVLPAACARNIASNVRQYNLYSVLVSLISGISGLVASYFLGTATGATIVLVCSIFFFITFFVREFSFSLPSRKYISTSHTASQQIHD